MSELQLIYSQFETAQCPEDVFGLIDASELGNSFKKLARAVHPDLNGSSSTAKKAFQLLNSLKAAADARVKDGTWGKKLPLPSAIPILIDKYSVTRNPTRGDIADIYIGKDVVVKVARSTDDNDLLRAEAHALGVLYAKVKPPVRDGLPQLVDNLSVAGVAGWKRYGNVLTYFPGFVTAEAIHQKMVIDDRTLVWMFKRLLSMLGWVHHCGFVHGAILPPHVMFYPDNDGNTTTKDPRKHALRLIDWCYSVEFASRTRLSAWVPTWESHYAPEIISKKLVGPSSDIYMAARLMLYLAGGAAIPAKLQSILDRCLLVDPAKRYQKADDVFTEWKSAAEAVYGSPSWHEFNLPK